MNLLTIRATLRRRVGNPSELDKPNSLLDEYVNTAYQDELADMFPFHATRERVRFPTIIGTNIYNLPTTYSTIHEAWNRTKRQPLKRRDLINTIALDTIAASDPSPGSTTHYARHKGAIQLYPMPGEIEEIELFCTRRPVALADNDDEPVLPPAWHPAIWRLARVHYWDEAQDFAKAEYAQISFDNWVRTKTNEFQMELSAFERGVQTLGLDRRSGRRLAPDEWRTGGGI